MKPIRGSQLTPNNVQEECIRVTKVYDWVFDAITTDDGIDLPPDCAAFVETGVAPFDVTCEVPDLGGFFPIDRDPVEFVTCTVSSRIDRREIPVNGQVREVGIVKVVFTISPLITIIDADGNTCSFRTPIRVARHLAVCAPEPFTSDNIICRILSINCDTNFFEDGVPDLGLQVALDICFEIQVEAEVKLEVLAKFCFPRGNDIEIPPTTDICPQFEWPEQCNFFPRDNCDCQAFVDTDAILGPVEITFAPVLGLGTLAAGTFTTELNADICDNCTLAGSNIEWIVEDFVIPTGTGTGTTNQSFVFTATEIGMPECTEVPTAVPGGITMMVVRGTGTVDFADPSVGNRTVAFTLTLVENAGTLDDAYSIVLTDLSGATDLVSFVGTAAAAGFVPDEDLVLQDCVTFPDLLGG